MKYLLKISIILVLFQSLLFGAYSRISDAVPSHVTELTNNATQILIDLALKTGELQVNDAPMLKNTSAEVSEKLISIAKLKKQIDFITKAIYEDQMKITKLMKKYNLQEKEKFLNDLDK